MSNEELLARILEEITKSRQLLEILARGVIKEDLEKVATTNERKKIWALCNGSLSTEEIAKRVGVSQRTVQRFIKELLELDLVVIERRGYPMRKFDYIPSDWEIELE